MLREFFHYRIGISLGLFFVIVVVPCAAKVKRHDTVIMKNGDRLTGEVKKLEQGVLYIETDYFSGSVGVDWLQVEKVESKATFQIVLSDGKRISGSISKEAVSVPGEDFKVHAPTADVPVSGTDVVQIESQKQTFWRQLKGSIDLGYNFTSGNNQSSLSTSASAVYPAVRWAVGTSYNASFNGQAGGATTVVLPAKTSTPQLGKIQGLQNRRQHGQKTTRRSFPGREMAGGAGRSQEWQRRGDVSASRDRSESVLSLEGRSGTGSEGALGGEARLAETEKDHRIRQLERTLGRKALEIEILKNVAGE